MGAILVVIRPDQDRDAWMAAMRDAGLAFAEFSALPRIFRVEGVTIATFPLVNHPGYEIIEPADMEIRGAAQQDFVLDKYLTTANWSIARIIRRRAPWPTNFRASFPQNAYFRCMRDGTGVDVYVIDSGIRATHAEFGGRAANVYDATGVGPAYFHGTAMASCAAGASVGLARAASLFSFQCLDASNAGTASEVISAMNQALTHYNNRAGLNRPAVVNMSLQLSSSSISAAVTSLIDAGMVVVACAGNFKNDLGTSNMYPAESDADVIVVGGTTAADIPYYIDDSGTNYGTRVDVSAPSQHNYFAYNISDSAFGWGFGTSFGCAYASGVVACLLQGKSRLTTRAQVQAVRSHVMNTATTGKVRSTPQQVLPDRLLYLNPDLAFEAIPGL